MQSGSAIYLQHKQAEQFFAQAMSPDLEELRKRDRVTITDVDGPKDFDVMDGQDGSGGGGDVTHEELETALAGKQNALTPDESIALQGGNIGVSLPTKSLTQAEYEALTEEEKRADKVYLVDEPPWQAVPLFIQEYDTEDGWHVRKWSNGYVELYGRITRTCTDIGQSGTHMRVCELNDSAVVFPVELSDIYNVQQTLLNVNGFIALAIKQIDANGLVLNNPRYSSTANAPTTSVTFQLFITGRWKEVQ